MLNFKLYMLQRLSAVFMVPLVFGHLALMIYAIQGGLRKSTLNGVIWLIAIFMILAEFGLNLGPLIASAGVIGVALGLGAQTLVRDILSGIFMLVEDQYGVGDKIDVLDVQGVVETVGLRITTVRDAKGTIWYLRNGEILKVGNKSQPKNKK